MVSRARVLQMMPAAPGMYAQLEGPKKGTVEYRLIVMWVLIEIDETGVDTPEQAIIGLTADDIIKGDLTHQGYDVYTTAVPKEDTRVTIVR